MSITAPLSVYDMQPPLCPFSNKLTSHYGTKPGHLNSRFIGIFSNDEDTRISFGRGPD